MNRYRPESATPTRTWLLSAVGVAEFLIMCWLIFFTSTLTWNWASLPYWFWIAAVAVFALVLLIQLFGSTTRGAGMFSFPPRDAASVLFWADVLLYPTARVIMVFSSGPIGLDALLIAVYGAGFFGWLVRRASDQAERRPAH